MHGSALRNHSCPTRNRNLDSQRLPEWTRHHRRPSAMPVLIADATVQEIVPVAGAGDRLN